MVSIYKWLTFSIFVFSARRRPSWRNQRCIRSSQLAYIGRRQPMRNLKLDGPSKHGYATTQIHQLTTTNKHLITLQVIHSIPSRSTKRYFQHATTNHKSRTLNHSDDTFNYQMQDFDITKHHLDHLNSNHQRYFQPDTPNPISPIRYDTFNTKISKIYNSTNIN